MYEIIGIVIAFATIIFLITRKQPLWLVMLTASIIVFISAGNNFSGVIQSVWGALRDRDTIDLALIVAAITTMAGLLQEFDFFDHVVDSLRTLLQSDRLTLLLVPGLVGCMPMVGGAIVSAPMVDGLGENIDLSPSRRSAANLIFRHSWYFVFPFNPTYILTARMANIDILNLIKLQWPLTLVMLSAGYFFILNPRFASDAASPQNNKTKQEIAAADESTQFEDEKSDPNRTTTSVFLEFTKYSSPIVVSLLLSIGLGLHLAAALIGGIILTLLLASTQREDFEWNKVPQLMFEKVDYQIVGAMASIMVFRASVNQTTAFNAVMMDLLEAGIPLYLVAGGLSFAVGYISASHSSTLALVLPIVLPLLRASGADILKYVMFIYCFGFLAYLISPLHLCQILTNRYFEVDLSQVYKIYAPVIGLVAVTAVLLLIIY